MKLRDIYSKSKFKIMITLGYIYRITNSRTPNKMMFIGRSFNPDRVIKQHFISRDGHPLHVAIQKQGGEGFDIDILEVIQDKDAESCKFRLTEAWKKWIAKYHTQNPTYGYNKGEAYSAEKLDMRGKKSTSGNNRPRKAVQMLDLEGNLLGEYPSLVDASNDTGINLTSIWFNTKGEYDKVLWKEKKINVVFKVIEKPIE